MRTLICLLLLLPSLSMALTDAELDKLSKKVKVFRQSDAPANCEETEEVSVPKIGVMDKLMHEKMLKRLAAQKGANGLMVTGENADEVHGTLYKCKVGK